MVLVRNSEFLTAVCTAGSKYATTILGLHTLTETMLVHAATIVWLKCSFHFIRYLSVLLCICYSPQREKTQFGVQRYSFYFSYARKVKKFVLKNTFFLYYKM